MTERTPHSLDSKFDSIIREKLKRIEMSHVDFIKLLIVHFDYFENFLDHMELNEEFVDYLEEKYSNDEKRFMLESFAYMNDFLNGINESL